MSSLDSCLLPFLPERNVVVLHEDYLLKKTLFAAIGLLAIGAGTAVGVYYAAPRGEEEAYEPPNSMNVLPSVDRGFGSPLAASFLDDAHGWIAVRSNLLRTTDGGGHWEQQYGAEIEIAHVAFVSVERGWIASWKDIYTTDDGGSTWRQIATLDADKGLSGLKFVDGEHGWASLLNPYVIVSTNDGGITWSTLSDPCPRFSSEDAPGPFSFIDPRKGWVACYVDSDPLTIGIFTTQNAGGHWTPVADIPQTAPYAAMWDLFFLDDSLGWLLMNDGLYASEDGGATWRAVGRVHTNEITQGGFVRFISPNQGYLSYASPTTWALFRTADGGSTWTLSYPPQPLDEPGCRDVDLDAMSSYGATADAYYGFVLLTNKGPHACSLRGRPGFELVLSNGRTHTVGATTPDGDVAEIVTLQPGQRASVTVLWPNACQPSYEVGTLSLILPEEQSTIQLPPTDSDDLIEGRIPFCHLSTPDPYSTAFDIADPPANPP